MKEKVSATGEEDNRTLIDAVLVEVTVFVPTEAFRVLFRWGIVCDKGSSFEADAVDRQFLDGGSRHMDIIWVWDMEVKASFFVVWGELDDDGHPLSFIGVIF